MFLDNFCIPVTKIKSKAMAKQRESNTSKVDTRDKNKEMPNSVHKSIVGTIQPVTLQNAAGVPSIANMLITGVSENGELSWVRPYPYMDCDTCGYGPLGCDCVGGFRQ